MAVATAPRAAAGSAAEDPEGRGYRADGRLAHLPPLDGIRGLGIPFVLLYHHAAPVVGVRFGGGFLTVSMFFTLSGFLITRLLIAEHQRTGTLSVRNFYRRRFRRLMPAALVVLLLIAVFWALFPTPTRTLGVGSFLSAMFYGENLYLLGSGNSYAELFVDRSPVQHMWSLSLEEQVYIVFPLLLLGVLALPRLRPRAAEVLGLLAAGGFAMAWYWSANGGNERAYYATEARAAEFLVGAAFAVFWLTSPVVPALARAMRTRVGWLVAGGFLVLEVRLWLTVDLETSWLFPWGVLLNSLVTVVIMGYASAGAGVTGLLSSSPLTFLGRISYGLYLVHWPVFLFLDADDLDLSSTPLFLLRTAVTFAITLAIFYLVEEPVRSGRRLAGRGFAVGAVALAAAAVAIVPFARDAAVQGLVDEDAVAVARQVLESLPVVPADAPTRSTVDPSLPARVLVVGDSQSFVVGTGLKDLWGEERGVQVVPWPGVGCGMAEITPIIYLGEEFEDGRPGCREWRQFVGEAVRRLRPQVVLVVGGLADVSDHEVQGEWRHIGDPVYDDWMRGQLRDFADLITSTGATVVWTSHPAVRPPRPPGTDAFPEEEPERLDAYNDLIRELAEEDPRIEPADLARFVEDRPGDAFDVALRPDGAHFDLRAAPDLLDWFVERVTEATPPG